MKYKNLLLGLPSILLKPKTNFMKKIFLMIVVASASIAASAQAPTGVQFGGGIRLALPVGDFSNSHSFGVGAELQAEYGFSEKVSGIFSTGYSSFFGKKFGNVKIPSLGYIPFLAGARVYPSNNVFIGAQVGYGLLTGDGNSEGAFNYQPQVGYNAQNYQLALNYNGLSKNGSTVGQIALTAIYKFGGN